MNSPRANIYLFLLPNLILDCFKCVRRDLFRILRDRVFKDIGKEEKYKINCLTKRENQKVHRCVNVVLQGDHERSESSKNGNLVLFKWELTKENAVDAAIINLPVDEVQSTEEINPPRDSSLIA